MQTELNAAIQKIPEYESFLKDSADIMKLKCETLQKKIDFLNDLHQKHIARRDVLSEFRFKADHQKEVLERRTDLLCFGVVMAMLVAT